MLGALIGYVPGAFVEQVVDGGLMLVLLACFVLFGVTGVLFRVPAYLIATSLLGIPGGHCTGAAAVDCFCAGADWFGRCADPCRFRGTDVDTALHAGAIETGGRSDAGHRPAYADCRGTGTAGYH